LFSLVVFAALEAKQRHCFASRGLQSSSELHGDPETGGGTGGDLMTPELWPGTWLGLPLVAMMAQL